MARALKVLCVAVSVALLSATGLWVVAEWVWGQWKPLSPADAFAHGTLGLETMPLKYALVLEQVSGAAFRSGREGGRSLWQAYGFIANPNAAKEMGAACVGNAGDTLPVGFTVSRFMPLKAFKTPVAFAGLSCTACHSAVLRHPDGSTSKPIIGMGNQELDIIAWSDGFRSAVLDPTLTASRILDAYDQQCGSPTGLYDRTLGRVIETGVISAWLAGIRSSVADDLSRYDLPYAGADLKNSAAIPAGPGRTRPFRSIVRVALNLPGADNLALSKIPVVFEQDPKLRPRSQYDGSVKDPVTRSFTAAYASGASVEALSKPEIVDNIKAAAAYTETLGITDAVPGYAELFPDHVPDPASVAKGAQVYGKYCTSCHGFRPAPNAPWSLDGASAIHKTIDIGTDRARLTFRYADMLPLGIWTALPGWSKDLDAQKAKLEDAARQARAKNDLAQDFFWRRQLDALELASRKYRLGHPLWFPEDDLIYNVGYINNPIPRAFLRAPYLHNGSVPTLRQLINLDPRPKVFCRGENVYDPQAVGYDAPMPDATGRCPDATPFLFDTTRPGNAAAGHDFPWAYGDKAARREDLEALLDYLKTL